MVSTMESGIVQIQLDKYQLKSGRHNRRHYEHRGSSDSTSTSSIRFVFFNI